MKKSQILQLISLPFLCAFLTACPNNRNKFSNVAAVGEYGDRSLITFGGTQLPLDSVTVPVVEKISMPNAVGRIVSYYAGAQPKIELIFFENSLVSGSDPCLAFNFQKVIDLQDSILGPIQRVFTVQNLDYLTRTPQTTYGSQGTYYSGGSYDNTPRMRFQAQDLTSSSQKRTIRVDEFQGTITVVSATPEGATLQFNADGRACYGNQNLSQTGNLACGAQVYGSIKVPFCGTF